MTETKIKILLIEDEVFDAQRVKKTISFFNEKIEIVETVSNGDAALTLLKQRPNECDVIIMDYQIAGTLQGVELIREIKSIEKTVQIIVITKLTIDITDLNFARKLMSAGAFWYCTKYPNDIEDFIYQPTDFILSIFNAFERKKLEVEQKKSNLTLDEQIRQILKNKKIISQSEEMEKIKNKILKVASSNASVLIVGASGTGKELAAYNIHYKSKRKYEKFIAINCGSLPNDLIESELFGYEKGAFTGAGNKKKGLFEIANNGTIFLDEIAELPLSSQVKLLRVIQDGEIDKIGRTDRIKVNVRIIAATNKNLLAEVEAGKFREDLYYRLNVIIISILPLKNRRSDIKVLVEHFLNNYSFQMGIETPKISDNGMDRLTNYNWPGNVRELKNVIQRILFITTEFIEDTHVDEAIIPAGNKTSTNKGLVFDSKNIIQWKDLEREVKYNYFKFVREHSASDAEAATKLGVAPPNFYRMSKELGLK